MTFRRRVRFSCAALVLLLTACAPFSALSGKADPRMLTPDQLLSQMTPEQKVGQLMVVSFAGTSLTPEAERMVRDYHVGGVILFQQNLIDAPQIRQLTGALQNAAKVPLLLAVDQEGGPVVRISNGATLFPSQMAIGATFSAEVSALAAAETARELKGLGFNVNFAPVADVNSNPKNPIIGVRSYGADPAAVGRLVTAAIEAQQKEGVLAFAKHFPGHGDADIDSHRALPLIEHSMARLEQVELAPFRAAIAAPGGGVDGIMTAHLLLPALEPDPKRSATLSSAVLGYLREKLGFKGLIVTDDLEMGAIVNDYGTAEAAKLAFQAGSDILLFRRTVSEQQKAHALLVDAVKKGEITRERLDVSVKRILDAKAKRGILEGAGSHAGVATASPTSGSPAAGRVVLDVARRSLTLVKNEGAVLPFRMPADALVCVVFPRLEAVRGVEVMAGSPSAAPGSVAGAGPQTLGDAIRAVHPNVRLAPIDFRPTTGERDAALACVREAKAVILGSYNLYEYPQQAALLKTLIPLDKPVAVVALRLPYDLAELEGAPALLAAYSVRPLTLQAVAETLFGRSAAPTGHLPVPVDPRWRLGHGLLDWSRPDILTAVR
jgi:beta-N-acetylhexosaminidase